jgi:hypothetical protein
LILFQGLVVIDVVLVGQGEAFVIFANPMDYQMALQRYVLVHMRERIGNQTECSKIISNPSFYLAACPCTNSDRQTIGKSFVEISPGSRSDYYSAIADVS